MESAGRAHQLGAPVVIVNRGGVRPLYREPDPDAAVVARAEPGVLAKLSECRGAWCRVETPEISGWMNRADWWGVYPDEAVP